MIEDKISKYLGEVCDGSGNGPKDGTGMKKQKKKRKGKMEKLFNSDEEK